jgi:small-conductance mechanosensitive channel
VKEFGDYGIVLRMKVTTKPGGAFAMKRKFYLLVNRAFKENGIELPVPTVHVQQGDAAAPAVAQSHLAARRKAAEAGEEAGAD